MKVQDLIDIIFPYHQEMEVDIQSYDGKNHFVIDTIVPSDDKKILKIKLIQKNH